MTHNQFDKYDKRCGVIKNLIQKEFKNNNFKFIRNTDTLNIQIINNNEKFI